MLKMQARNVAQQKTLKTTKIVQTQRYNDRQPKYRKHNDRQPKYRTSKTTTHIEHTYMINS